MKFRRSAAFGTVAAPSRLTVLGVKFAAAIDVTAGTKLT